MRPCMIPRRPQPHQHRGHRILRCRIPPVHRRNRRQLEQRIEVCQPQWPVASIARRVQQRGAFGGRKGRQQIMRIAVFERQPQSVSFEQSCPLHGQFAARPFVVQQRGSAGDDCAPAVCCRAQAEVGVFVVARAELIIQPTHSVPARAADGGRKKRHVVWIGQFVG